ncbi:unnamed protein product, partial [Brassica rapa subsp. narinosa]
MPRKWQKVNRVTGIALTKEPEKDPISQKAMLQLTPPLLFTTNLKKGKGVVFNFDKASVSSQVSTLNPQAPKLIASAISADSLCRPVKLLLVRYQSYHQSCSQAPLR